MLKKLALFLFFSIATFVLWALSQQYNLEEFKKVYESLLAISIFYLVFKLVLEEVIIEKISDSRTRYSLKKATEILFIAISSIVILRIWVINPQALLVAYGLVAAGVAIALQDIFKNFAGSIAILLSGIYRTGDRVEINSKQGDVIDIGVFYTSLMEIGGWIDGDQATGRIVIIPNGKVLHSPVYNYTKDHRFMWDELSLPITYESNWRKATQLMKSVINEKTKEAIKNAETQFSTLQEKYYVSEKNIEPNVFLTVTDNWIMLKARYVADVHDRRLIHSEISTAILEAIEKEKDITISSETIEVTTATKKRKR